MHPTDPSARPPGRFNPDRYISQRARAIDASGIRRVFDLAATLKDPVNLSIGQPDFDVPEPVKLAAIRAIQAGQNRYTATQGTAELRAGINALIGVQLPRWADGLASGDLSTLITSGVSGGLVLSLLATVGPGDEVLIPDPYFVMYKHLVALAGATPVYVDTYPDFQLTADRLRPHITDRTRLLLFNSPSNPTGVVATAEACRQVAQLSKEHNFLVVSDEIYDRFVYDRDPGTAAGLACPSPTEHLDHAVLLRGFSKTYAMTGWRMGYAVGPTSIIEQMAKLQQYTFVCAPSMVQAAGLSALQTDMTGHIDDYRTKRDRVVERLSGTYELTRPGGAFYAFPRLPDALGQTATRFIERAVKRGLLIIPGSVFSRCDTHIRISFACDDETLDRGLDILLDLAKA